MNQLNSSESQLEQNTDYLINLKQVLSLTGKSKSSIHREVINGSFPSPVRTGKRAVAWRLSELKNWMDSLEKTVIVEG